MIFFLFYIVVIKRKETEKLKPGCQKASLIANNKVDKAAKWRPVSAAALWGDYLPQVGLNLKNTAFIPYCVESGELDLRCDLFRQSKSIQF